MARFVVIRDSNGPKIINTDEICTIEKREEDYQIKLSNNNFVFVNKQNAEMIFSAIGQRI